jgi:hypothetical protein
MPARPFAPMLVVALALVATPVLADAIDGDWCAPGSAAHMRIEGPDITTPAGTRTTGNYSRHAFSYVVPSGDPGAGDRVDMQLLSETEVRVIVNGEGPETWRRCQLNA